MACEAAGAVRTVQALTREDDCFEEYSRSLETPLRKSERSAIFSTGLFAISQSLSYFCIALVRTLLVPITLFAELVPNSFL